jgi:hypothetical protein
MFNSALDRILVEKWEPARDTAHGTSDSLPAPREQQHESETATHHSHSDDGSGDVPGIEPP